MAKLRTYAAYCALICAIIALAAGQEPEAAAASDDVDNTAATAAATTDSSMEPVSEPPIQLVHVLNPGEREYLSPNLIGVQNIAMSFLPLSMNFINIIDAYREVVNGVRYEILLNAVDTRDNDKELVCELVILEKPWLRTQWGDKVRELTRTNCTDDSASGADDDRLARGKALNEKYIMNSIFNGGTRNELNADEMANLDAQIMPANSRASQIRPNNKDKRMTSTTTTTETYETTAAAAGGAAVVADAESEDSTTAATDAVPQEINDDKNDVPDSTQPSISTTTETKELSEDEKNWLDNIFSIGAFNFEQQIQQQQLQRQRQYQQLEQQAAEDERNEQILIEKNEASNYVQQQTMFEPLVADVNVATAQGFAQYQQLQQQQQQFDGQQQLQEPLAYEQQQQEQQQQQAADINNLQLALSQDNRQRSKRSADTLTGGKKELDLDEAHKLLQDALDQLSTGDVPGYKVTKIYSARTQLVSGTINEIDADVVDAEHNNMRCLFKVWSQPWKNNGNAVTFTCSGKDTKDKRQRHAVQYAEKKSHKKKDHHNLGKVEHLFNKFQVKYNRRYETSMEHQMRLRIFQQNLRIIDELNRNEMGSAKYGITEFADMTSSEYKMRTGLWQREEGKPSAGRAAVIPDVELPKEFDWREKGAVTPVKNQGNCGSCWAFSVTGNIEGLNAVKTGQLQEFSEQELLDCDTVDSACNGGLPDNAYKALEEIGGLEYEAEYPYKAKKEQCTFNKTMSHVKVSDFVDLPKNETAIAQWLITNGPISIGINANAMQFYRGGVSHPWKMLCSAKNLDHGVLIVGYGVSEYPSFKKTLPYWIIKNSWGPKWGEQGYYRVYRGENTCGVSEMASSAVLA